MRIIDHLIQQINEKTCPVVVGLDPVIGKIPEHIKDEYLERLGNNQLGATEALLRFNLDILEAIHTVIPAVKLQSACYELYGALGAQVFEQTVQQAQKLGLTVIDDSKRSDIGHSAELYAQGHLGDIPLIEGFEKQKKADFMTVNPLLGSDSIKPFVKQCQTSDKGIFILARTSNPSSEEYQLAKIGNQPLFQKIAQDIHQFSLELMGENDFSSIGAVVGAKWPKELKQLRNIIPHAYFLVPGYGAQGATSQDVVNGFNEKGYGALINSSRAITFAYRDETYSKQFKDPLEFAQASKKAVLDMREALLNALSKAGKLPLNW
ncbi:MAG: orotidine-5'-phosphate decarboxylase [Deltaproteobacteria bacterium]|nr:orotidine-5'-phosphate decarboxylase [Deltaproteobacteria bacterium]